VFPFCFELIRGRLGLDVCVCVIGRLTSARTWKMYSSSTASSTRDRSPSHLPPHSMLRPDPTFCLDTHWSRVANILDAQHSIGRNKIIFSTSGGRLKARGGRLKAIGDRLKPRRGRFKARGGRFRARGHPFKARGCRFRGPFKARGGRFKARGDRLKARGGRFKTRGGPLTLATPPPRWPPRPRLSPTFECLHRGGGRPQQPFASAQSSDPPQRSKKNLNPTPLCALKTLFNNPKP
jgi:hypothetical protein